MMELTFLTCLNSYPDPFKEETATHVNYIVKFTLIRIAKDVTIIDSEKYYHGDMDKVDIL